MSDQPTSQPPKDDAGYRVLARKYRPTNFDDLIGQEPMIQTLSNAFKTGRIAQAYMLTGVRGVGKTTTARILARALNYEADGVDEPTLDIATPGTHCPAIMEGNHVDVIEMDAASHTGIGDIREIIASVRYKPVSSRYKVYIIDEVHMLSTAAFNGLLKTLEEPPEHVKFIFATTEIRKVPITVLSRCQRFDLRRVESGEMTTLLSKIAGAESIAVEDEALAMIARAGEGSVRDALSIFDQAIAHSAGTDDGKVVALEVRSMLGLADRGRVIDLFEQIMKGDISAALAELKDQYDTGADPATVLTDLAEFVHFVTRVRYVESALDDPSLSQDEKSRGKEFADKLSPRILGRTWQMLLKGIAEVQTSPRPVAAADMVLVRLTHAADLPTPDEVVRKLEKGGAGTEISTGPSGGDSSPSTNGGSTSAQSSQGVSAESAGEGQTIMRQANGPVLMVDNGLAQQMPEEETSQQPTAHLHIVPDQEPPVEQQETAPKFETVNSFQELLALAEKKRALELKLMLRNHFGEISFADGEIEFALVGKPRQNLVNELRNYLKEWTGKAWNIVVSQQEGSTTLKEREAAEHEALVADVEQDPVVAAILSKFPRSKIVDIKLRGEMAELTEADAFDAGLENPDNEVSDSGFQEAPSGFDKDDPGAGDLDDYFNS